ncbi:MAG: GNAT family N-acetyltransferase, partial [Ruminococcaceae bacterium]|nr:GNAT family N-acetyltransferase [Oscillospiraceae bacterium]
NGELIAYLRVLDRGVVFDEVAIGRVLCLDRRKGIGTSLMREGIKVAGEKLGADRVVIEAQTYVREMYDKLGFVQTSGEFLDHGIPHIKMELEL